MGDVPSHCSGTSHGSVAALRATHLLYIGRAVVIGTVAKLFHVAVAARRTAH
jgi:hypothetical protein